jgi:hypothetical protein
VIILGCLSPAHFSATSFLFTPAHFLAAPVVIFVPLLLIFCYFCDYSGPSPANFSATPVMILAPFMFFFLLLLLILLFSLLANLLLLFFFYGKSTPSILVLSWSFSCYSCDYSCPSPAHFLATSVIILVPLLLISLLLLWLFLSLSCSFSCYFFDSCSLMSIFLLQYYT